MGLISNLILTIYLCSSTGDILYSLYATVTYIHSFCTYVNYQTIVQYLYYIIIYTLYSSSSDQPFITIKR